MKPIDGREYLTTGQIAVLCGVAARTVSKWIDSGKLIGHRLPLSQDRRVHRDDLTKFLRDCGRIRDLSKISPLTAAVLTVGCGDVFNTDLRKHLPEKVSTLYAAESLFVGGRLFERLRPQVVVVDFAVGSSEALGTADAIWEGDSRVYFIGILPEDMLVMIRSHVDWSVQKPVDPSEVAERILEHFRIVEHFAEGEE